MDQHGDENGFKAFYDFIKSFASFEIFLIMSEPQMRAGTRGRGRSAYILSSK